MKLECNFHYMKEVYALDVKTLTGNSFKRASIHIYEYSVYRYGSLKHDPIILYMVCKANKDGYAADKDIKRGFYTFKQALNYAIETYKLSITKECDTI